MLLQPGGHELVKSVELHTVDAQEVAWNADGDWLAIRDTASNGYKVLIYTADGHLYKNISSSGNNVDISLGVRCMQWIPSAGTLAIGDNNNNITILSKNNVSPSILVNPCQCFYSLLIKKQFSPIFSLYHPATIMLPKAGVWEEQVNASKERSYVAAPQPASPPTSQSLAKLNSATHGVSVIAINSDESMAATRNDFIPTTVWIWSLTTCTVMEVLIHHSPVKQIIWHPSQSDLLLIHCAIPEPAVHLWKTTWHAPRIVSLPLPRRGRLEASWLKKSSDDTFNLLITSAHHYTTGRISSDGEVLLEAISPEAAAAAAVSIEPGAEDMFDEGNSLDLSPIKISHSTVEVSGYENGDERSGSGFGFTEDMLDDTFHYRRHVKAVN